MSQTGVEIKITGSVDASVAASTTAAAAALDKIATSTERVTKTNADLARTVEASGQAIHRNFAAQIDSSLGMERGIKSASASFAAFEATIGGQAAIKSASVGMRAAGESMEKFGLHTTRSRAEIIVLAHEMVQGRFSRIPGSLMVLAESMGGLAISTMAMVAVVATAAGGLVYLAYSALESQKNIDHLTEGFALTGRAASVSGGQVAYMLGFLNSLPGSSKAATQSFVEFVAQHANVSLALANQTGQLLPAFIRQYGEDAPKAVEHLTTTLNDLTVDGFQKLDRDLLALDPTQYQIIMNLIETGKQAEAVNMILKQLGAQSGTYMKSVGDQVYDIKQNIERYKDALTIAGDDQATMAILIRRIADEEKKLAEVREGAAKKGKQDADFAYKSQLDYIDKINSKLTERQRLEKSIADINKGIAAAMSRGDKTGAASGRTAAAKEQAELDKIDEEANAKKKRELEQAANERERIEREANKTIQAQREEFYRVVAAMGRDNTRTDIQISRENLEAKKADLDRQLENHEITVAQKFALEEQLVRDIAAADIKLLENERQLNVDRVEEYNRYTNQIRLAEEKLKRDLAQMEKDKVQAQKQEDNERLRARRQELQGLISAERGFIQDIFSGRVTVWEALGRAFDNYAQQELEKFIENEILKTSATEAGESARLAVKAVAQTEGAAADVAAGSAQILNDAYKAAAGAYSAVVGIPVVGPILAPIAAGTAFAAVAAFNTLTSFDVGTNSVPRDMVAMVHQGERIIPKADNDDLMNALDGGRGGGGGDTYVIQALDSSSFARWAASNPAGFQAGLRSARQRLRLNERTS